MAQNFRRLDLWLAPPGDEASLIEAIEFYRVNGGIGRREISLISRAVTDGTLFALKDERGSLVGSLAYAYQDADVEMPAHEYKPGVVIPRTSGGHLAAPRVIASLSNMGIGTMLMRGMITFRRMLFNERDMPNIALVRAENAKLLRFYHRSGFLPDLDLGAALHQGKDEQTYQRILRGELISLKLTESAVLEALKDFDLYSGVYGFQKSLFGRVYVKGEVRVQFMKDLFSNDRGNLEKTILELTDYVIAERARRLKDGEPE